MVNCGSRSQSAFQSLPLHNPRSPASAAGGNHHSFHHGSALVVSCGNRTLFALGPTKLFKHQFVGQSIIPWRRVVLNPRRRFLVLPILHGRTGPVCWLRISRICWSLSVPVRPSLQSSSRSPGASSRLSVSGIASMPMPTNCVNRPWAGGGPGHRNPRAGVVVGRLTFSPKQAGLLTIPRTGTCSARQNCLARHQDLPTPGRGRTIRRPDQAAFRLGPRGVEGRGRRGPAPRTMSHDNGS